MSPSLKPAAFCGDRVAKSASSGKPGYSSTLVRSQILHPLVKEIMHEVY